MYGGIKHYMTDNNFGMFCHRTPQQICLW